MGGFPRRVAGVGVLLSLILLTGVAAPAAARRRAQSKSAPPTRLVFKTFNIGGPNPYGDEATHQPEYIARGSNGNMWFSTIGQFNEIGTATFGQITPSGTATLYPDPNQGVIQALANGFDGNVWFTDISGADDSAVLGRVTTAGQISDLPGSASGAIARGPGGMMWAIGGGGIESIDASGNVVATYPIPGNWAVNSLTEGRDGNLWFAAVLGVDSPAWDDIGRMTPTGAVTMFRIPTFNAVPQGITAGPDGNVWFGEHAARIGRITPSGRITEFRTKRPYPSGVSAIVTGPDGNMWFADGGQQAIGRITPAGKITEFPVPRPTYGFGYGLAFGDSHTLWFTEADHGVIGRATIVH